MKHGTLSDHLISRIEHVPHEDVDRFAGTAEDQHIVLVDRRVLPRDEIAELLQPGKRPDEPEINGPKNGGRLWLVSSAGSSLIGKNRCVG